MSETTIYTLGTGLRSIEDFIEILLACDIKACIDVRSFPKSKLPHFTAGMLEEILREQGIAYHLLGRELGGFRKGGYRQYSLTDAFMEGIGKLEAIARDAVSVIICAEHFPWKCHRRWIAWELQKRHWAVIHILDKGKVWAPQ